MLVGKCFRVGAAAAGVAITACAAEAADFYGGGGCNGGCGDKDGGAAYAPPLFLWQGVDAGAFAGAAWSSIQPADNVIILTGSGTVSVGSLSSTGLIDACNSATIFSMADLCTAWRPSLAGSTMAQA